ncbi:MAG TPA: hypothetical protein VKR06_23275 [Ktedonosporobacter sp.]|nr:hypothetical protein [Ktedonosporobacter sp.]
MIALLMAILLGVVSLAFVLYPLYRPVAKSSSRGVAPLEEPDMGEPSRSRRATPLARAALKDDLTAPGHPCGTGNDPGARRAAVNSQVMTRQGPIEESTQLAEREQLARTALQEVELDYQLGNIAEADYRSLRERYMRRALVALKSRYDREQEIDDEIEQELREIKERDINAAQ